MSLHLVPRGDGLCSFAVKSVLDLKVENAETWGLEVFTASSPASRRTALPLRVPRAH